MLNISSEFLGDIQGNSFNLVPLIEIDKVGEKIYVSTQELDFNGIHYSPLLLNVPSLKESFNFESRKYTISSVRITLSNYKHLG